MLYGYKGDFTHSCAPRVIADTVWERRKIEGEILLKKNCSQIGLGHLDEVPKMKFLSRSKSDQKTFGGETLKIQFRQQRLNFFF